MADRVKIPTTYPMPPDQLVETLTGIAAKLPAADRISCGFPGMVRGGHVLERAPLRDEERARAPRSSPSWSRPGRTSTSPMRWRTSIDMPCRVANDADVQGAAVVQGYGFEAVITFGTGFGTALFMDGRLLPHLEFSHLEFRKGETFNEQLGEPVRKKIGDKRWNTRIRKAIAYFDALTFFDHLFIGGGNAQRINRRDLGEVLERITVVDNTAGILGGIKLWDGEHIGLD